MKDSAASQYRTFLSAQRKGGYELGIRALLQYDQNILFSEIEPDDTLEIRDKRSLNENETAEAVSL